MIEIMMGNMIGYLGRQIGGNATGGENSNIIGNFIGNMIENTTGKQGKYDRIGRQIEGNWRKKEVVHWCHQLEDIEDK